MKNPERINFNYVLLENIDIGIPISKLLSNPTLTHNHGNPSNMKIKSNHNVSHTEQLKNIVKLR